MTQEAIQYKTQEQETALHSAAFQSLPTATHSICVGRDWKAANGRAGPFPVASVLTIESYARRL